MYKPRKQEITLTQLLATKAVELYSGAPNKYSLKNFHINPFVRMLGSRAKFDLFVRRIYPSFILVKCGVQSDNVIGPINVDSAAPGKRVHFSSCLESSRFQKQIKGFFQTRQKAYSAFEYKCTADDVKEYIKAEIKKLVAEYSETKDPIISVTKASQEVPKTENSDCKVFYLPITDSDLKDLAIPDQIRGSSTGIMLTGLIYKYLYMNNLFANKTSQRELWVN